MLSAVAGAEQVDGGWNVLAASSPVRAVSGPGSPSHSPASGALLLYPGKWLQECNVAEVWLGRCPKVPSTGTILSFFFFYLRDRESPYLLVHFSNCL